MPNTKLWDSVAGLVVGPITRYGILDLFDRPSRIGLAGIAGSEALPRLCSRAASMLASGNLFHLDIANFDVRSWFAMAAPAGTPKPVIERLNGEVRRAVDVPEVKARLVAMGGEPAAGTPEAMRERVSRELATWTKTVDDAGIAKQ